MIKYQNTFRDYCKKGLVILTTMAVLGASGFFIRSCKSEKEEGFKNNLLKKYSKIEIHEDFQNEHINIQNINENNKFFSTFWENNPLDLKKQLIGYHGKKISNQFLNAEKQIILGRLKSDPDTIIDSYRLYKKAFLKSNSLEEMLTICENASMLYEEAGLESPYFDVAKLIANNLGLDYKINIYDAILKNKSFLIESVNIEKKLDVPENPKKIIFGNSFIELKDGDIIGSQQDRVVSDWYSARYRNKYDNFQNKQIIPWQEGNLVRKILKNMNAELLIFNDTFAFKINNKWYATDENGMPKFEVLIDKIKYPSTKLSNNVAYIVDTHGISALVSQAITNKVDLVIGCGDSPGKMQAANYLSQKGINVFFANDRFMSEVIGYTGKGILMGTAPVKDTDEGVIIGNQPLVFDINEKIILQNTIREYPVNYYDAPTRYFSELQRLSGIKLNTIEINVDDIKQTYKVIEEARKQNADFVGIRVAYKEDYLPVKKWLKESKEHKAILFHSGSYDSGYSLFFEFPDQTSFGDSKPIFVREGQDLEDIMRKLDVVNKRTFLKINEEKPQGINKR